MDPLTQGALGAAIAQAAPTKVKYVWYAGILGFIAGMAPDLDALLRSSKDPLFFLEYHRHFTHSLIFIPVGGLICALGLYYLVGRRWGLTFFQTFGCCTLGYATHGIIDAATSYGTLLLWPFSADRVALSVIPIVDPLFTVPLIAIVFVSAKRESRALAGLALLWFASYLSIGALQQSSALSLGRQIAESRRHTPAHIEVKPSFANILVWKTIYEEAGYFYVDAVRVGLRQQIFYGTFAAKLDVSKDLPWLDLSSQQAKDVERFSKFSGGFLAVDPQTPNQVADIRYSFVPNEIRPLWSIELSPGAEPQEHATYKTHREDARESLDVLLRMIFRE